MNCRYLFFSLLIFLGMLSCNVQQKTYIITGQDEQVIDVGNELADYLSKTYPSERFEVVSNEISGDRNILLEVTDESGLENKEAFKIFGKEGRLVIQGKTPRALAYGVFGLLKYLGWNFYLSFEVPPVNPKSLDFSAIKIENAPLKERRILFNWHNFLSGCTGWDYKQWENWIDNGRRIGFNTIMVHAYGNNPMHSFSYNGQEKELGYLSTTLKGRDWGTQHANDIRRLYGGEIFQEYEFGSEAAKVPDAERSKAATSLMQQVFKHAAQKGMEVCFALDVDTWMANPQNIIKSLPDDALIEIGGYQTVDPEHPEGRKYYEAQLRKLFSDYPEITMLAAWMRQPRKIPEPGSIWLAHELNTLPEKWRIEYTEILKKHPELTDKRPYPGLFALSKMIQVYREILDQINPDIELALGSWDTGFVEQADAFMPEYCGFIPLDYSYVLNKPEIVNRLKKGGKSRRLYPIVWAHHDDHRYLGRPYIPYSAFNRFLVEINATGYGIIHWTTHPLDLFFHNYENQVWQNTVNESYEKSIANFSGSLLKVEDKNFIQYYKKWFLESPMFGRETSDYFLGLWEDYTLDGYSSSIEVVEKAKERLKLLKAVDSTNLNSMGLKEYHYQLGMENFIISLFTNHDYGHKAFALLKKGNRIGALPLVEKLNPQEPIDLYAKTINEYGATRGEEGILISLNLRWLPDYLDLQQRVRLKPIWINFQPTSHDSLAQGAGKYTFFIDQKKNFWLSLGEKELGIPAQTNGRLPLENITDSWLTISKEELIPIKTMRNLNLPKGTYEVQLFFSRQSGDCLIQVLENEQVVSSFPVKKGMKDAKGRFRIQGEQSVMIRVIPERENVKISGIKIQPYESQKE